MEKIIEELITIISQEIDAFNRLLTTLHEKQRAIVEGEVARLNDSVRDESRLTSETQSLEAERLKRSQALAEELEMKNLNPKLSEIIVSVEKKYARRLQEQRDLLKSLIGKIQVLNKNNQFLLNYSLNFIEKSMELLLTGHDPARIYEKDGKMRQEVRKVIDKSI